MTEEVSKGLAQADLPLHQLPFVVYDGTRKAVWETGWARGEEPRQQRLPRYAALSVVQAPKAFGEPVTQRKSFRPAFKVRLLLQYRGNLQLPLQVKLEAWALGEPAVQQLLGLHREGCRSTILPSLTHQQELEHSLIKFCIQVQEGQGTAMENGMWEHVEDQEFSELRFGKSSRMHKRWILFSCRFGAGTLFVLYKIPTIVLSRKTDQFEKASSILLTRSPSKQTLDPGHSDRTGVNSQPQSPNAAHAILKWIMEKYEAASLSRPLEKHDLMYLQAQAHSTDPQPGDTYSEIQGRSDHYKKFQEWFLMCLRSLKQEEDLWCSTDPIKICHLMIDRNASEDILMKEPAGTFLVRLCSEPGAFAISVKAQAEDTSSGEVKHYLVDALDLRCHKLGVWISMHKSALYLLDIASGNRTAKNCVITSNAPTATCPLLPGLGQARSCPGSASNLFPRLAICKDLHATDAHCRQASKHEEHQVVYHSHLPTKPTKEQLMHLAAACGFDVSQGLGPVFHSRLSGTSSLERDSELAKYCGVDSNQFLESSKTGKSSGFLLNTSTDSMSFRIWGRSPGNNIEQVAKRSRLGSY